jgi:hypothetical protein
VDIDNDAAAEGTAFDKTLNWVPASRGFLAKGTHNWDACLRVAAYVAQGEIVAFAEGALDDGLMPGEDGDGNSTWTITTALETLPETAGQLKNGPATATAVAVVTSAKSPHTQVITWETAVELSGRP